MSSPDTASASIDARPSRTAISYLTVNRAAAQQLPAPTDPRTHAQLIDRLSKSTVYQFVEIGVLEKRGHDDDGRQLWGVPPRIHRWIRENCETETTPCGCSTGFRNARWTDDGEFTCRNDECRETFDRETALEVVGR